MMHVIAAVEAIKLPTNPVLGPALLALTEIISDPYPGHSVIPSICKATYDRRLLVGETAESVLRAITGRPAVQGIDLRAEIGVGEYTAFTGATLRCEKFFPAWLLPEDDAFVARALVGLQSAGLRPPTGAYRFCTNAAYSAGIAGIPTVGFGPATKADAHVVDERLRLADLLARPGYRGLIAAVLARGCSSTRHATGADAGVAGVVAVVGGGGKSSTVFRLAAEVAALGKRPSLRPRRALLRFRRTGRRQRWR